MVAFLAAFFGSAAASSSSAAAVRSLALDFLRGLQRFGGVFLVAAVPSLVLRIFVSPSALASKTMSGVDVLVAAGLMSEV